MGSFSSNESFLHYSVNFMFFLCGYEYRVLTFQLIVITFPSFTKPTFAAMHLRERNVNRLFLASHLVSVVIAIVDNLDGRVPADLQWTDFAESAFLQITFIITVIMYFVSVRSPIGFRNQEKKVFFVWQRGEGSAPSF